MENIVNLDDILGTQEEVICIATTHTEMDGDAQHLASGIAIPFAFECGGLGRATRATCGRVFSRNSTYVPNYKP